MQRYEKKFNYQPSIIKKSSPPKIPPSLSALSKTLYLRRTLLLHCYCIATDMLCHSNAVAMWKQCSSNARRR